jgi:hypothetical protein
MYLYIQTHIYTFLKGICCRGSHYTTVEVDWVVCKTVAFMTDACRSKWKFSLCALKVCRNKLTIGRSIGETGIIICLVIVSSHMEAFRLKTQRHWVNSPLLCLGSIKQGQCVQMGLDKKGIFWWKRIESGKQARPVQILFDPLSCSISSSQVWGRTPLKWESFLYGHLLQRKDRES